MRLAKRALKALRDLGRIAPGLDKASVRFQVVSEGERGFDAVAVVADTDALTPPCGSCRQILWEFCGDAEVVLANLRGKVERYRMSVLLPKPFDGSFL